MAAILDDSLPPEVKLFDIAVDPGGAAGGAAEKGLSVFEVFSVLDCHRHIYKAISGGEPA